MNTLYAWAQLWQIPMVAIQDLQTRMGLIEPLEAPEVAGKCEAWVQSAVRLEASQKGLRLWRNNVGALADPTGRVVRYGLANDTKALNTNVKSGDLIGIKKVMIEPRHVGYAFGLFVSLECKTPNWQYTGTEHEIAQVRWQQLVTSMGGEARFITGVGTL